MAAPCTGFNRKTRNAQLKAIAVFARMQEELSLRNQLWSGLRLPWNWNCVLLCSANATGHVERRGGEEQMTGMSFSGGEGLSSDCTRRVYLAHLMLLQSCILCWWHIIFVSISKHCWSLFCHLPFHVIFPFCIFLEDVLEFWMFTCTAGLNNAKTCSTVGNAQDIWQTVKFLLHREHVISACKS